MNGLKRACAVLGATVWSTLSVSCISVNLSQDPLVPADQVSHESPSSPFREISSTASDKTWRNHKTGTTITYISECGSLGRLNLKEVARTSLRTQGVEVQRQEEDKFHKFSAIRSFGKQKKGDTHVELLTFQSKNCLFNIAYLGTKENLEKERAVFEKFKDSFNAP